MARRACTSHASVFSLTLSGFASCAAASARANAHFEQALIDIKQANEARQAIMEKAKFMHRQAYDATATRMQTHLDEQVVRWYVIYQYHSQAAFVWFVADHHSLHSQLEDLQLRYEAREILQQSAHEQASDTHFGRHPAHEVTSARP